MRRGGAEAEGRRRRAEGRRRRGGGGGAEAEGGGALQQVLDSTRVDLSLCAAQAGAYAMADDAARTPRSSRRGMFRVGLGCPPTLQLCGWLERGVEGPRVHACGIKCDGCAAVDERSLLSLSLSLSLSEGGCEV